ncbi:MAG: hypothetical protein F9K23_11640 [Bacteroidetes bacterium]|nr:MAG: hypothetical protein F9K23_11640 [Bacteroidota bacterium]
MIGPNLDPRYETQVPVYFLNGLGLTAATHRTLKDITPYLGYFPTPLGDDEPYNKGEYIRTGKVLELIDQKVRKYKTDTQKFAKEIVSKGLAPQTAQGVKEICRRLYQWLIDHVQYKQDRAGREELRRPARVVKEARNGVDCDCFSYFISTVLTNLSIPHHLRIIAVGKATAYHHIYVIVPHQKGSLEPFRDKYRYTVVDPVLDTFDEEPQHITAYHDYPMTNFTTSLQGIPLTGLDDLYQKLSATRAAMQNNPQSYYKAGINPSAAIPLITQALDAWYTPRRQDVLNRLAQLDHTLYTGMNGVPMNGFFQNVSNAAKKVVSEVKTVVQTAVTDPKKLVNQTIDQAKQLIDKAIDYGREGVLFIPRKAFLALVELNVRGLASDFKKGLSDPAIADRMKRVWEGDLGGNFSNFTSAINTGANKPFLFGLRGLAGEPVTVASLTASAGAVLAIVKPILDAISKGVQVVNQGKDIVQTFVNKGDSPAALITPQTNLPLPYPVSLPATVPSYPAPTGVNPNYSQQTSYDAPTGVNPNYQNQPAANSGSGNNKTLLIGAGVATGLVLLYAATKKKKGGLNGLQGKTKKSHSKKRNKSGKTSSITF